MQVHTDEQNVVTTRYHEILPAVLSPGWVYHVSELRQDDPTDPAAWNNRGNALLGLGRFEEAKDSFQQALDISGAPNDAGLG